jgi:hypothetical protein
MQLYFFQHAYFNESLKIVSQARDLTALPYDYAGLNISILGGLSEIGRRNERYLMINDHCLSMHDTR